MSVYIYTQLCAYKLFNVFLQVIDPTGTCTSITYSLMASSQHSDTVRLRPCFWHAVPTFRQQAKVLVLPDSLSSSFVQKQKAVV